MTTTPRATRGPAMLRSMTTLWTVFTAVIALAGVAVPLIVPDPGSTVPAILPIALAAAGGVAALAGIEAIDRGMLASRPADDRGAIAELRSRFVMQAAIAEAPALLAVALAVVLGPPVTAAAGAVPGLIGMLRVRPRAARFDRFDDAWREAGLDVSLRRGLS